MNKNKVDIPEKSGVYLFKSKKDKILYIGKAKNLKKRVNQYFHKSSHTIISRLIEKSEKVDYILTDNDSDALHLEYNLIHQHNPPFNIRLKDDKRFPFIEISTRHLTPGIYYSRDPDPKNLFLGPIADTKKAKVLIDMITRIFKIRSCSELTFRKKTACLYFYIDRCSAPCIDKIDRKDYLKQVANAIIFLKGKREPVLRKMQLAMQRWAEELEFEKAQKIKDEIELIRGFELESYISSANKIDYDTIAFHNQNQETMLVLFSVVRGGIRHREFFCFQGIWRHKRKVLREFLLSFYQTHNLPAEIIVPVLPEDHQLLETLFRKISDKRIRIKIPYRGNKKKTLDLAIKNLNFYIWKNDYSKIAENLKKSLRLNRLPDHIEGVDISHLSERERVGAVVVYKKGKPVRSLYRNYIIQQAGTGDTEALREVLERRFEKPIQNPDLLLIDGGLAQLGIAKKVKRKLGITSDIVALAKREERIFPEYGESVVFSDDSPEKFLFQNIRDEVHRRAIQHHQKIREKIYRNFKKK